MSASKRNATLAEQFGRRSDAIEVDGRLVEAVARFPVTPGDSIRVTRLTSTRSRPQAIVLAADGAGLSTNGVTAPSVALWSTTAPREVDLVVGDGASEVEVWNAWMVDHVEHAWVGNAGLVVQDTGGTATVQCSDGMGEADFTDLVVQVAVTSLE